MADGSHPVRGAWIEIPLYQELYIRYRSHPVRGAWIVIARKAQVLQEIFVAPRQGCVD